MLMIRKYFLIRVISVATSIICEWTWSQVSYETCTIQDSYVTSVVPHCPAASLFSLFKVSPLCTGSRVMERPCSVSTHKKNVTTPLKLHHWVKNSISEKWNYLNFKCWNPALIVINYKFWIPIFLGSQIDRAGCKVKSTFNFNFILYFF